jgi:predicted lipoprotein
MKKLMTALAIALATIAGAAHAADAMCEAKAADKKLAGAAKTSFVKKCEKDLAASAGAVCEKQAADKKLAGAAKNSFVKKCKTDAASAPKA